MAKERLGVWGIDLGQCALKAIRLEDVDGQITATAFDYIEHPKILSQPDADPDQLTREALEQFLSRNKLKGDMVVIAVPGQSGLARFVKLPPVEEKKIADIVKFEAKQQIPFPLEEVVWDFQKLGSGMVTDGFALETEIGLFAMKRDMVARYMQHFADVKVEVHLIQMAPLALCNFLAFDLLKAEAPTEGGEEESAGKKKCIVALDIGTDNSNLVISDGSKIIWQRPIPLGGNHFTRALTKDLKLTFAKAEHLKRNAVKSPELKKILSALKPVLNDFVAEVQRSLGYFTNTHRDAEIQYMVGLGNAFRLPGLQKYLQEKLQLEVRKLTKLERLTGDEVTNSPTYTENVLSFAVAYGLALQGLRRTRVQTNLLPQEIRVERLIRAKKPWAAAAAAALLLGIAGMSYGLNLEKQNVNDPRIKAAEDKVNTVDKEIARLKSDFAAQEARLNEIKSKILTLGAGVEDRDNWHLLYRYISLALPRPDGSNLGKWRDTYHTEDAKKAYEMLLKKRFAIAQREGVKKDDEKDPDKEKDKPDKRRASDADEEFIKNHLVQINIEGITPMYCDDLSIYFKNIWEKANKKTDKLNGMHEDDKEQIRLLMTEADKDKSKAPKKGWVIEIRGYTYNKFKAPFVEKTFLDNLKPEKARLDELPPEEADKIRERITTKDPKVVPSQVGYFYLLEGYDTPEENPEPGKFKYIRTTYVPALIKDAGEGAGGPVKEGRPGDKEPPKGGIGPEAKAKVWSGLGIAYDLIAGAGGAAPAADKDAPVRERDKTIVWAPRTEFVLLFVWTEVLTADKGPEQKGGGS